MKFAAAQFGRVDVLVNNAGIQHVASVEDFPAEKWDAIIAINLSSAFHTTRLALPAMKAANWGRIINLASVHGLVASAQKSAYVAAKHGIVGLTKIVALENATTGVTCNAICPGWVLTPLVQKQIDDQGGRERLHQRGSHPATAGRKGALDAVHHARGTGRAGRVLLLTRREQRARRRLDTWTAAGRRSKTRPGSRLLAAAPSPNRDRLTVALAGLDRHRRMAPAPPSPPSPSCAGAARRPDRGHSRRPRAGV